MKDQLFDQCYTLLLNRSKALGISVPSEVAYQLIEYVYLMHRWNRTYNLTAVRNVEALVTRHIIDSFTILPHLPEGSSVLDIGTGAGLPGLPAALMRPDLKVTLLDSNGKKACFLKQVISDLNLPRVHVEQCRVELFQPKNRYDVIVARAFSSLANLLEVSQHLSSDQGIIVAMKGMYPNAELDEIQQPYTVHEVMLPEEDVTRHIVVLDRCPISSKLNSLTEAEGL